MAAPTYTWTYVENIFGYGPPKMATLEAAASLETKEGTLLCMTSGQVAAAGDACTTLVGLATVATTAAAASDDAVQVLMLRLGDVIKGTADADSSSLAGFSGKLVDLNSDGSLDYADTSDGSLSVYKTENSGLTVYCVPSVGAYF